MKTIVRTLLWFAPAALGIATITGCGDTEEASLTEHTPVTYPTALATVARVAGHKLSVRRNRRDCRHRDTSGWLRAR